MQYRHVLNNKMRTDNCNAKEVTRLFQYLTMVLMSTYHHAELTRHASTSALHDLLHVIISILLEPKMEQLPDGAQLLRALNVLTVKIVDRSDHTNITSAIVKLLSDAVANASLNPKFAETVMKCIWKIIRLLPNWMEDEAGPLDVDLVLSDLHDFLKTYPPSYWKKQVFNKDATFCDFPAHEKYSLFSVSLLSILFLFSELGKLFCIFSEHGKKY